MRMSEPLPYPFKSFLSLSCFTLIYRAPDMCLKFDGVKMLTRDSLKNTTIVVLHSHLCFHNLPYDALYRDKLSTNQILRHSLHKF